MTAGQTSHVWVVDGAFFLILRGGDALASHLLHQVRIILHVLVRLFVFAAEFFISQVQSVPRIGQKQIASRPMAPSVLDSPAERLSASSIRMVFTLFKIGA